MPVGFADTLRQQLSNVPRICFWKVCLFTIVAFLCTSLTKLSMPLEWLRATLPAFWKSSPFFWWRSTHQENCLIPRATNKCIQRVSVLSQQQPDDYLCSIKLIAMGDSVLNLNQRNPKSIFAVFGSSERSGSSLCYSGDSSTHNGPITLALDKLDEPIPILGLSEILL